MFCASLTASSGSGACPALSVASGTSTSPENSEQTSSIFSLHVLTSMAVITVSCIQNFHWMKFHKDQNRVLGI